VERFALSVQACPDKAEYRAAAMALASTRRFSSRPCVTGDMKQPAWWTPWSACTDGRSEFDAALAAEDTKKNKKFVTENRYYFWVARYNQGLKLLKEEKDAAADLEFYLSRLVDATDPKAYSQGAIALINLNKKSDAAALVQEGLARAPRIRP
jgi:hypothetical protein